MGIAMKINEILPRFLLILCLLAAVPPQASADAAPPIAEFRHDDLTIRTGGGVYFFTIELARTPAEQEQGLMHRDSLDPARGMLFIMPEDSVMRMWMKDTLIPLDMLFIDRHGKIVYIAANATPESEAIITAGRPVRAVLELAGGVAELRGIHVGDHVVHSYFMP